MTVKTKATGEVFAKDANTKTYTYNKVLKESVSYFNGDELAATTWMNKYAMTNENGEFVELSPNDMHNRMAKEFARIEAD